MTYRDIIPENTDNEISKLSVDFAKELTKTNNKPYTLKDSVEGPNTLVVFSPHFVEMFREAFSNECIAKMSKREKWVYWDYLAYMSALMGVVVPDYESAPSQEAIDALETDYWNAVAAAYNLVAEYGTPIEVVQAVSNFSANEVWDTDMSTCYTNTHTWED